MEHYFYFAATYDSGAYGACTYQGDCTSTTTPSTVGAPDTGFLSQPQVMVPLILGGAILIAALVLATKKIIRKIRH